MIYRVLMCRFTSEGVDIYAYVYVYMYVELKKYNSEFYRSTD